MLRFALENPELKIAKLPEWIDSEIDGHLSEEELIEKKGWNWINIRKDSQAQGILTLKLYGPRMAKRLKKEIEA